MYIYGYAFELTFAKDIFSGQQTSSRSHFSLKQRATFINLLVCGAKNFVGLLARTLFYLQLDFMPAVNAHIMRGVGCPFRLRASIFFFFFMYRRKYLTVEFIDLLRECKVATCLYFTGY